MMKVLWLSCLFLLSFNTGVKAGIQTDHDLNIERIASLNDVAWGMALLNQNTLLITLRQGQLVQLNLDTGQHSHISGLPQDILAVGQGGLFDIKLSPNYAETGWVYFTYSKDLDKKGATTLARAKLSGKNLTEWQDLLVTDSMTSEALHYGGRITFDQSGHLFLSIGDRGHRPNGQNLNTHAGKILRVNLDGSAAPNNPFINTKNAKAEIWSYGHRNPQGLFFDPHSSQLWEIEHGPRGGDEINLIQRGNNYGWAEISYGKEYWAPIAVGKGTHQQGMEQPVHKYIPSIAPSSLIVYQGDLFNNWQGKLLATALSIKHLNVVEVSDEYHFVTEQRLLESSSERLRNVIEGENGELYLATDSGAIYRIKPKTQ